VNQVPVNDTSALNKSSLATTDVIDRLYFALSGNDPDHRVARLAEFELEVFGITLQVGDMIFENNGSYLIATSAIRPIPHS
jgi:hypothetical protein